MDKPGRARITPVGIGRLAAEHRDQLLERESQRYQDRLGGN